MRFAITSAIAWTAVLAAYFACITASDGEWAYAMMRVFKILSATMFIWYSLVAIMSKGSDRFAVGYAVSFITILLLASIHHFDAARPLGQWIEYYVSKSTRVAIPDLMTRAHRELAHQEMSLVLCAGVGGILGILAGRLSAPKKSNARPNLIPHVAKQPTQHDTPIPFD